MTYTNLYVSRQTPTILTFNAVKGCATDFTLPLAYPLSIFMRLMIEAHDDQCGGRSSSSAER